jgi:hypothetical protein
LTASTTEADETDVGGWLCQSVDGAGVGGVEVMVMGLLLEV